ncbi:quercetin dioxygenase-like cupin family protein [Chitinophaga niastensis]|uniref:Quercetin dioxygenase-like cupin family protein n=1 Tax=Chitinophaga niastensis TaxID=536980 RepID=A0A2P8HP91_CHINA|nr:aspartyl/asparaginyl beta-hydroxylase domain-containing protein [Chitinophaga niastensis]PSL48036.1 quercetin dioxygenase-like cupin family protein [Chitinophaga niastensis]
MNYIKFAIFYDVKKLCADLDEVLKEEWPAHFNTKDFNGDWRSISLRSASGNSHDIYAHSGETYKNTPALNRMPYAKKIIDSWHCDKESIRLLSLAPGSIIKPHRDPGCAYSDGSFRIHIPVLTNQGVYFTIEEEQLHLKAGECWYIDFSNTHSIVNEGNTSRVHLIIDGIRNEWTDKLFAEHGYQLTEKDLPASYDAATNARIIEELEKMNTETARDLIAKLKAGK